MYATDFEYDEQRLSDYGFIVCNFDFQSGADTVKAGSEITFNLTPYRKGESYWLQNTQYDECIQSTFDICKNPDIYDDLKITNDEYRDIMRWLNRKEFLRFRIVDYYNEFDTCYYDASFNIEKITISEILYGLRLSITTDKPFGYGEEQRTYWEVTDTSKIYKINDISDEIGFTYPKLSIVCQESGTLNITNLTTNLTTTIKNCSTNEIITIDSKNQIITSSLDSHKIYDDFNFEFFKLQNTFDNRTNEITISIPCTIEILYSPIIKDSI